MTAGMRETCLLFKVRFGKIALGKLTAEVRRVPPVCYHSLSRQAVYQILEISLKEKRIIRLWHADPFIERHGIRRRQ